VHHVAPKLRTTTLPLNVVELTRRPARSGRVNDGAGVRSGMKKIGESCAAQRDAASVNTHAMTTPPRFTMSPSSQQLGVWRNVGPTVKRSLDGRKFPGCISSRLRDT